MGILKNPLVTSLRRVINGTEYNVIVKPKKSLKRIFKTFQYSLGLM